MMGLNKFVLLLLISFSFISSFVIGGKDDSPSPSSSSILDSMSSDEDSPSPTASPSSAPSQSEDDGLPLLFPTDKPSSDGSPVLKKVCSSTDHPEECVSSVSLLKEGDSDPVAVLKTEMDALRQGFKKAIAQATKLNNDPSVSEEVKGCLDTCLEIYDSGLYDLDDAAEAIASHDVDKLKTVLSATVSDIDTCEEAFEEEGLEGDSPMKEYDAELSKLASNNLAIASSMIR